MCSLIEVLSDWGVQLKFWRVSRWPLRMGDKCKHVQLTLGLMSEMHMIIAIIHSVDSEVRNMYV